MPVAIPTKSAELEEMLGDAARMQAVMSDPMALKEFITSYARASDPRDELKREIADETKKTLDAWMSENGVKRPPFEVTPENRGIARGPQYNPHAPGAAIDGKWNGLADFAKATWHRTIQNSGIDPRLKNDFSGVIGSDGGFLVPETLRSTLLQVAIEGSIVRSRATVVPMESLRVPFPAIDDSSHASSVMGGLIGYWTEESAALTESQASFARVVLEAHKLIVYSEVPNELIADSILSFEAFLNRAFPTAIQFFEDVGFLRGSGTGEPLGMLNANALVPVAKETGQAAATVVWENIVKMYSRMLPSSLGNAVWLANNDVFPQLATMSLNVGTGGSAIWLNNGTQGPPMTILGRPVLFTEKLPTLGTVGDIMFVDESYYLVGDRMEMLMSSSPHYKFANDQTAYRIINRVDGRPWVLSALTPRNGTNTLSPYVALATRA